jgi:hypothetical protein
MRRFKQPHAGSGSSLVEYMEADGRGRMGMERAEYRKEVTVARHAYEITVLSPDLDQPGLHAILEGMRELGLDLVSIRQAPRSAGSAPPVPVQAQGRG